MTNIFLNLEDADNHASEMQWQSPTFDMQRNIDMDLFIQRMNECRSCSALNQQNNCEDCSCFMPIVARIDVNSCPRNKWNAIIREPNIPSPPLPTQSEE